jgi:NAD(P)-dependent dehydrogenase (short-subunit alcohol dehydrogenase family)
MKKQKVWFITGASKGFGFEIAKSAIENGDQVVASVRDNPQELYEAFDNDENLLSVVLDVTKEPQAKEAIEQAIEKFGRIDVLVNNAGYSLFSAVEEASDQEVRKQFDTNLFGVLNVLRAALPFMRKQKSGHIINISALYGFAVTLPGYGLYGATKFAIEAITEGLAIELRPLGLFATAVEPGMFSTSLLDKHSMIEAKKIIEDYKETVGHIRSAIPGFNGTQPGDPAKFGKAIVILANSDNPPVHLPLGNDSAVIYRTKATQMDAELEKWKDLTSSTNHTPSIPASSIQTGA